MASAKEKSVMEAYKRWVRRNRDFVHSLESLANGITWLLPERFSNSEIGPEAVYALLGIVTAVNQHIMDTTPTRMRPLSFVEKSFPWSLCVSMLKDVETVVEVAAQHFVGDESKWNFIAVTEAIKALVRLAAFRDSGYKMLLQGGELVNAEMGQDVSGIHHVAMEGAGGPGRYSGSNYIQDYHGSIPKSLEGRAMSALSRYGEHAKMTSDPVWLNRIGQNSEVHGALPVQKPTLSTIWSERGLNGQLFVTGEVLFILRPLIYVLFIRKFGIRSWKPWLISLAVDLTGMGFLSYSTSSGHRGREKVYQLSSSEKDELKRRKLIWALYIMRDPFFTMYTKHHLEKTDGYLSHVPMIGFLTAKLVELIIGAQTRYTYTSGS